MTHTIALYAIPALHSASIAIIDGDGKGGGEFWIVPGIANGWASRRPYAPKGAYRNRILTHGYHCRAGESAWLLRWRGIPNDYQPAA